MQTLIDLIKKGMLDLVQPDPYPETPSYSSVALIFKPSSQQYKYNKKFEKIFGYDILLLRRKPSQGDYYSGHICFPGGKIQKGQNYLAAVIRQTFQQTGIQLNKQKHLIYTFKRRFIARYHPGKDKSLPLMVNGCIFFIPQRQIQIKIDDRQIGQYKWIPLSYFLFEDKINTIVQMKHVLYTLSDVMNVTKQQKQEINQNFVKLDMPSWQLNMGMKLFGFTFYIVAYLFTALYFYGKKNNLFDQEIYQRIQRMESHAWNLRSYFKQDYPKGKQSGQKIIDNYKNLRILSKKLISPKIPQPKL